MTHCPSNGSSPFSAFLLTPLIGVCIAAAVAAAHRRVLRLFGFLSALGAVALLLVTIMFTLDVVQLWGQVPLEGQSSYRIGATRAWVKNLAVVAALVWLAVGALRGARSLALEEAK